MMETTTVWTTAMRPLHCAVSHRSQPGWTGSGTLDVRPAQQWDSGYAPAQGSGTWDVRPSEQRIHSH